jgi:hypothetical protein
MANATSHLGIELTGTSLRLALVEPKSKKLLRTAVLPLAGDTPEAYDAALSGWLEKEAASQPHFETLTVALPAARGVIRLTEIPAETDSPAEFVEWELGEALDAPLDAYYHDEIFVPNAKKPTRAVVVAFRKEAVDKLRGEALLQKGLRPQAIEPDIFALLNLLEAAEGEDSLACIVKAESTGTLVLWGDAKNGPKALRVVLPQDATAKVIANLLTEGLEPNKKRVFLTGEKFCDGAFLEDLNGRARGLDLIPWNSFKKLSLDTDAGNPQVLLQCSTAIGAAFGV